MAAPSISLSTVGATDGSSARSRLARAGSAPPAWSETSHSRSRAPPSTPTSTRPTTRSTTGTGRAWSERWCRPRRPGQPSGSCLDRRIAAVPSTGDVSRYQPDRNRTRIGETGPTAERFGEQWAVNGLSVVAAQSALEKPLARNKQSVVLSVKWGTGAGDGTRTRDILLGKQTLCQLSYSRSDHAHGERLPFGRACLAWL